MVNGNVYVLKSNGTLYFIKNNNQEKSKDVEKITTFLDDDCNAEGLCYDDKNDRLYVACKTHAKKTKAVFEFDIQTKKLRKDPLFEVNIKEIHTLKRTGGTQKAYEKFLALTGADNITFNPSGIAIHPITREVFILSARGNTMVVLSEKGDINYVVHLKKLEFAQPEGITFDDQGTLFIANEGSGGKANIKAFKYKK